MESKRLGTSQDMVDNVRQVASECKALLMDKIPNLDIEFASEKPLHVDEGVWFETNDSAYIDSKLYPLSSYSWNQAGSRDAFYVWEGAPWGMMQYLQVKTGELAVFVSGRPDATVYEAVESIPGLEAPPDHHAIAGLRLNPGSTL